MSKVKAFICTVVLFIVVLALLFATMGIESEIGLSLFDVIIAITSGFWFADRLSDFYKWLQKVK